MLNSLQINSNVHTMDDVRRALDGIAQAISDITNEVQVPIDWSSRIDEVDSGGGAVTSVTAADATLTISPTAGAVLAARAALTGDVTAAAGLNTTVLATVNANVGAFGTATATPRVTVNAKGLVTAAVDTAIAIPASQVTDFNEAAQDAVGAMVDASLTYVDATPLLQRAALTGDVTAAAGSNATTIAADAVTTTKIINDAVTNAKLANMAADTIKGRANGAGTGDPTDLTATQVRTISNVADGANNYVHPNHSGDVTSVADGAQTIANDAVTYAKMQNATGPVVIGRVAASSGNLGIIIPADGIRVFAGGLDDNIGLDVNGLTEDFSPDETADFLAVYDTSAGAHKKVKPGSLEFDAAAVTSGTLPVARGGTGATTFTDGGVLVGNVAGAVQATSAGTVGQVLTSNGAGVDPTFQAAAGGGSTGVATIDFGAFPGRSDTSLVIAGQAAIVAGSIVQAWLRPVATADHTADEHVVEPIRIEAGNIVAGTGFTIYGINTNGLCEPRPPIHNGMSFYYASQSTVSTNQRDGGIVRDTGGNGTRIHGLWTVQWRWS